MCDIKDWQTQLRDIVMSCCAIANFMSKPLLTSKDSKGLHHTEGADEDDEMRIRRKRMMRCDPHWRAGHAYASKNGSPLSCSIELLDVSV